MRSRWSTVTDATRDPRERCPTCGGAVMVASEDPLEEYGIEPGCDYYRAAVGNAVIRE